MKIEEIAVYSILVSFVLMIVMSLAAWRPKESRVSFENFIIGGALFLFIGPLLVGILISLSSISSLLGADIVFFPVILLFSVFGTFIFSAPAALIAGILYALICFVVTWKFKINKLSPLAAAAIGLVSGFLGVKVMAVANYIFPLLTNLVMIIPGVMTVAGSFCGLLSGVVAGAVFPVGYQKIVRKTT